MDVWLVFIAALLTALCTGLGVLPFLFIRLVDKKFLGAGNAVAAGLMIGASALLVLEAVQLNASRMLMGFTAGLVTIWIIKKVSPDREYYTHKPETNARRGSHRMLLVMIVMTVHSFAEGIGVGVSFGGREGLGQLITAAIALHNIPEGLAIGLVLIPRGVSITKAGLLSIFSSLPQPLMAVPAFLFVTAFQPLLPIGLGIAAGAMVYMVMFELLPEAQESTDRRQVILITGVSAGAMLLFQFLLA